ncbi:hypothetical protein [Flavobacterium sp. '19STA2R22 D10 B1']|uniref:hypothetical protein n=1 Tax=Flavobacterium aerium TaxID=3037261 RepID=UPI00278C0E5D|nr:hypothetical protein [Flavobacterium sp. '19STA2R22 D10 B1']
MIKKIVVSICLLFSLVSVAQEATSSPYSFYGIGDVKFKGTIENRSMGGLGILSDSIHINLQNPASYASLKRTTMAIAGTNNATTLKSNTGKETANRTSLDYLAVAFPMGKFGAAFGLLPYSSVGYKIESISSTGGDNKRYTGEGGMNKVFVGLGYQVTSKLSIGLDINYNFGKIETRNIVFKPQVQYGSRELNTSDLSGASFNFGAMYKTKLNEKLDIYGSLSYMPGSTLTSKNTSNIATISYNSNGAEIVNASKDRTVANTDLKIPSKVAFGAGIGAARKWFVGTEITLEQTSKMGNRFDDMTQGTYEDSKKVAFGGYYIPNYASYTSYLSRVTYRGGFKFENTGLVINNQGINDMGMSLGVGLPVGSNFSNINIGLEYGKRGTTSANLIQENYFNLSIGLSLSDLWFRKSKFD